MYLYLALISVILWSFLCSCEKERGGGEGKERDGGERGGEREGGEREGGERERGERWGGREMGGERWLKYKMVYKINLVNVFLNSFDPQVLLGKKLS